MVENEKEKKDCPECEAMRLGVALSIRSSACSTIKDPEKKMECVQEFNQIDPEKEKDIKKWMSDAYDIAGIEVLDTYAANFNELTKETIVAKVGEKLERERKGEKGVVTPQERALFRKYAREMVGK
jgi:hypothetical protein